MSEVFCKFLIQNDRLVIAKCTYHKQLVNEFTPQIFKGGGWWVIKDDMCILFGDSHDFGAAKLEDIAALIESGKVYRRRDQDYKFPFKKFAYRYNDGTLVQLNYND